MPRILSDGWVAGGMLIGTFGWMFPFIMYRAHLADKKREKRI
jgi:hypothetical protein